MREPETNVTELLAAHGEGREGAFEDLVAAVYQQLQEIAHRQLRRSFGNTLATTGLVHEAYLKLVDQRRASWKDRSQFYGIAANAMRQILVDRARRRLAQKRGGDAHHTALDDDIEGASHEADRVLAVHEALARMADLDGRLTRVVECRYFAGLTEDETATALEMSVTTVQRSWKRAKAWLREELDP